MENDFDLKKFLVESKLTTNSRMLTEARKTRPTGDFWDLQIKTPKVTYSYRESGLSKEDAKQWAKDVAKEYIEKYGKDNVSIQKLKYVKPYETVDIDIEDLNLKSAEINYGDGPPRFESSYIEYVEWKDGTPLTDEELDILNDNHYSLASELAHDKYY